MSIQITEADLKAAYAEINVLRQEREQADDWPDALFQLVESTMGEARNRRPGKLTYKDLAAILSKRGWWKGSPGSLAQAFRKERDRRRKLNEGE